MLHVNDTVQKHDHVILYNKVIKNPKEVKDTGNQCQKEINKIEMNIQMKHLYKSTQIVNFKKLLGVYNYIYDISLLLLTSCLNNSL